MFLVLKRFPLDDVPLCLVGTKRTAKRRIEKDRKTSNGCVTEAQEALMANSGIGMACCAYLIIKFNEAGLPIGTGEVIV